jgi:hypothetical protein
MQVGVFDLSGQEAGLAGLTGTHGTRGLTEKHAGEPEGQVLLSHPLLSMEEKGRGKGPFGMGLGQSFQQ